MNRRQFHPPPSPGLLHELLHRMPMALDSHLLYRAVRCIRRELAAASIRAPSLFLAYWGSGAVGAVGVNPRTAPFLGNLTTAAAAVPRAAPTIAKNRTST